MQRQQETRRQVTGALDWRPRRGGVARGQGTPRNSRSRRTARASSMSATVVDVLFVRALNQVEPAAIAAGTLLAIPFVSPDGQWVGYHGEGFEGPQEGAHRRRPCHHHCAGGNGGSSEARSGWPTTRSSLAPMIVPQVATRVRRRGYAADSHYARRRPATSSTTYWPEALPDGRGVLYTVLALTAILA